MVHSRLSWTETQYSSLHAPSGWKPMKKSSTINKWYYGWPGQPPYVSIAYSICLVPFAHPFPATKYFEEGPAYLWNLTVFIPLLACILLSYNSSERYTSNRLMLSLEAWPQTHNSTFPFSSHDHISCSFVQQFGSTTISVLHVFISRRFSNRALPPQCAADRRIVCDSTTEHEAEGFICNCSVSASDLGGRENFSLVKI